MLTEFDGKIESVGDAIAAYFPENEKFSPTPPFERYVASLSEQKQFIRLEIFTADQTPIFSRIFIKIKGSNPDWRAVLRTTAQGRTSQTLFRSLSDKQTVVQFTRPIFSENRETVRYVVCLEADGRQIWKMEKTILFISLFRTFAISLGIFSSVVAVITVLSPYRKLISLAAGVRKDKDPKQMNMEQVISTFKELIVDLQQKEEKLKSLYASAEKRADRAETYTQDILKSISSGVLTFNRSGKVTIFNQAALNILHLNEDQCKDKHWEEFFSFDQEMADFARDLFAQPRNYSRHEIKLAHTEPDQSESIWIGISSSLVRNSSGDVDGITFLFSDLTESKKLQFQLEQERHLASMGEMSAGIAHEFRNSLSVILGFSQLLQRHSDHGSKLNRIAGEILKESNDLKSVIDSFLNFARPPKLQKITVQLNRLLADLLDALSLPEGVTVEISFQPDLPDIQGDESTLRGVFQNLMLNAIQAMPEGGVLRCGTKSLGNREAVLTTVSDMGVGINPEHIKKIFTPFFTTKKEGTGLGLAIAYRNVLAHNGLLTINSQVGKGTTVSIKLPVR